MLKAASQCPLCLFSCIPSSTALKHSSLTGNRCKPASQTGPCRTRCSARSAHCQSDCRGHKGGTLGCLQPGFGEGAGERESICQRLKPLLSGEPQEGTAATDSPAFSLANSFRLSCWRGKSTNTEHFLMEYRVVENLLRSGAHEVKEPGAMVGTLLLKRPSP